MDSVWQSAARSHRGNRRPVNEDAVLQRAQVGLWAVADGLGGHVGGRAASRAVIRALRALDVPVALADRVDAIDDLLQGVNRLLRRRADAMAVQAMGATVVVMTAWAGFGAVLWAGDSRLYRLREGALELLTRDHTPAHDRLDGLAQSAAGVDKLEADAHVVTRAVGCHSVLQLDVAVFDIDDQDTLLLCSDGLYRELGCGDLTAALSSEAPDRVAGQLLERCLRGAARDNVSLVVIRPQSQTVARSRQGARQ